MSLELLLVVAWRLEDIISVTSPRQRIHLCWCYVPGGLFAKDTEQLAELRTHLQNRRSESKLSPYFTSGLSCKYPSKNCACIWKYNMLNYLAVHTLGCISVWDVTGSAMDVPMIKAKQSSIFQIWNVSDLSRPPQLALLLRLVYMPVDVRTLSDFRSYRIFVATVQTA